MLYRNLLRHQWKEFIRNPSWSGISGVIVRDISTAPDTLRELERYFAVEET